MSNFFCSGGADAARRNLFTPCLARIPKGLSHSAQGCEERATLGEDHERETTPTGLNACRSHVHRRDAEAQRNFHSTRGQSPLFTRGLSFTASFPSLTPPCVNRGD